MKTSTIASLALALSLGPAAGWAESDGEKLFSYHGCVTCHGAEAKDPASKVIPVLAGKSQDELFEKAKKILSGKGETKASKIMHAAFFSPQQCDHPPTDDELAAITTYIASVPAP